MSKENKLSILSKNSMVGKLMTYSSRITKCITEVRIKSALENGRILVTTNDTRYYDSELTPIVPMKHVPQEIFDFILDNNCTLLLVYLRGSHMYELNDETSDMDYTFIYRQSTEEILKENFIPHVNLDNNNISGYEVSKYLNLLSKNNPNILESLDLHENCLIYSDGSLDVIFKNSDKILSKLCEHTILGYGESQITKATGLNKHMNSGMSRVRKSILEFCYILKDGDSILLMVYLGLSNKDPMLFIKNSGLANYPNGKGMYALYLNSNSVNLRGIVKDLESTDLRLSSIPKEMKMNVDPINMYYNLDGYQKYCKEYSSFISWDDNKNESRYLANQKDGQGVDLKNMMHLFRLLEMANVIAIKRKVVVVPNDKEFLKSIKLGIFSYDELVIKSNVLKERVKYNFYQSRLRDLPDYEFLKEILYLHRLIK